MPLIAQGLAPFFGTHTCPKAALAISFNSALAMIFHLIFPKQLFIFHIMIRKSWYYTQYLPFMLLEKYSF